MTKFNDPFSNEKVDFIDPFAEATLKKQGGLMSALGAGVDGFQEIGYRALKGFTDVGENPDDYQEGSIGRRVSGFIGQGGYLSDVADRGIKRNIEQQAEYTPTVQSYKDVDGVGSALSYVGELTAQSAPLMAATLNPVGLFAMGGGLANKAYEEQEEKNALRATLSGFGQAGLEKIGTLGAIGKLNPFKTKNAAVNIASGAVGEGATEVSQDLIAQWGGGTDLNELDFSNLDESFIGGAAVGGTIRGGAEAYNALTGGNKSIAKTKEEFEQSIDQLATTIEGAIGRGESEAVIRGLTQRYDQLQAQYNTYLAEVDPNFVGRSKQKQDDARQEVKDQGGDALSQEAAAASQSGDLSTAVSEQVKFNRETEIPAFVRQNENNQQAGLMGDALLARDATRVNGMQEWQPNFTIPQEEQARQVDGEFIASIDFPNSVATGNTLGFDDRVGEIEAERQAQIPNKDILFGQDGRPQQQARENAEQITRQSIPKGTAAANVRSNGNPFPTTKSVQASGSYKAAVNDGINPQVVSINGGYGWESNADVKKPLDNADTQAEPVAEQVNNNGPFNYENLPEEAVNLLQMFDDDLNQAVESGNKDWIDDAIDRANKDVEFNQEFEKTGLGTTFSNGSKERFFTILKDPSNPGKFRFQQYDKDGFISHETYSTAEEAIKGAVSFGAKNVEPTTTMDEVLSGVMSSASKPQENKPNNITKKPLAQIPEDAATETVVDNLEVVEANVSELTLSDDVPQFKSGANTDGVVEPLGGSFDRKGVSPVQVWVRNDGRKEVISGRHRLDLAKRSGEQTIPAQYYYESEGFNAEQASGLDAILNIRDGQGKVKDYVQYFKQYNYTQEEANAEGVLGRATGKRAFSIANKGSEAVVSQHSNDQITDEAAYRIGEAAPNNEALQAVGLKAIQDGKSITVAENMIKAVSSMTGGQGTTDMFGFDDSALVEAEAMAKAASAKQTEIRNRLSAIRGAAKNPKVAKQEGIDIRDPKALESRIASLTKELQTWDNWHTNPDMVAQIRQGLDLSPSNQVEQTQEVTPQNEDTMTSDMFGLTQESEQERQSREQTESEQRNAVATEQRQQDQRTQADKDVDNFSLTGSNRSADVATAAGQNDLFGAQQPPKETTASEQANEFKVGNETLSTGKPTKLFYAKNREKAPRMVNMDMGQDIEPAGDYLVVNQRDMKDSDSPSWDYGTVEFKNPLVVEHKTTNSTGWKKDLSDMYGGKTGKALATAIKKDGYDGILTIDKDRRGNFDLSEAVNLAGVKTPSNLREPTENIDDFGEKLEGARKDLATKWNKDVSVDDIEKSTLSQVWPKDLFDNLGDTYAEAFAFAARAEIPSKPRKPYLVKSWAEKVSSYRGMLDRLIIKPLMSGDPTKRELIEKLMRESGKGSLDGFASKIDVLTRIDKSNWSRIGMVSNRPDAHTFEDGKKVANPYVLIQVDKRMVDFYGANNESIIDELNEKLNSSTGEKRMKFTVRGGKGNYYIHKDGDREYTKLITFKTTADAFAFKNDQYDKLVELWDGVKDKINVTKADVRSKNNEARTGENSRNGENVTPDKFTETFGFRGVQFGNWVAKQSEKQQSLNDSYDALIDLANVVGVEPKALSLGGKLGLAFGARGKGKAMAHYEPDNIVINLTKTKGAGSLAHEWFHALDNYFANTRENTDTSKGATFITQKPEPMYVHKTQRMTGAMTKERLEFRRKQNPTAGIFNAENWELDPKHPNGVRKEVESKFADLVAALEDSPMRKRSLTMDKKPNAYWSQIIERAARSFENYVISKLDKQGIKNDYLANIVGPDEFVRDKERYPYLIGEELAPIENAFDALFETIETKEDGDGNVIMFNRSSEPTGKGVTQQEATNVTQDFIDFYSGVDDGMETIITDKKPSEIFGDAQLEPGDDTAIKGGFDKTANRLFIFSQNHKSVDDVQRTLREELLVHKGLGFLQEAENNELLSSISETRNSKNKDVKAIWADVDKNYAKASEKVKAEEFLGKVAQKKPGAVDKYWNQFLSTMNKIMVKLGLAKPGMRLPEMRTLVYELGDKLKQGERTLNEMADSAISMNRDKGILYKNDLIALGLNDAREYSYQFQNVQDKINSGIDENSPEIQDAINKLTLAKAYFGKDWDAKAQEVRDQLEITRVKNQNEEAGKQAEAREQSALLDKKHTLMQNFMYKKAKTVLNKSAKVIDSRIDQEYFYDNLSDMGVSDSDINAMINARGGTESMVPLNSADANTVMQKVNSKKYFYAYSESDVSDIKRFKSQRNVFEDYEDVSSHKLDIKTPYFIASSEIIDFMGEKDLVNIAELGYDSVVGLDLYDIAVLDVSAVNTGDIRFNRAQPETIQAPVEKKMSFSYVKRMLQDKFAPIKDMQISIEGVNGQALPDDQNTYLAEELFYGKTEDDLVKMKEGHVEPLVNAMKEQGVERAELDLYLIAKHAQERNAYIASINPDMPDGGSGMTNQEARDTLRRFEQDGNLAGLAIAANEVYKMTEKRRALMREAGLESEELLDVWDTSYKFYVPLKGYAQDSEGKVIPRTGKGFAIKGNESMRALGRRSIAESPLGHAINDLSETIIRARKNEVGNTFLKMVENNPSPDIWEVFTDANPDTGRAWVASAGEVRDNQPINMRSKDKEYFPVKRDGETFYIKLKDKDGLLIRAMQNMGPEPMNGLTKSMAAVTRWLSMVNTSLNPEFTITNFSRDIQTAMFNALAEQDITDGKVKGEKIAGAMVKNTPKAVRALWKHSRKTLDNSDPMNQWVNEFLADGAKTGYFDAKDVNEIGKDLENLLDMSKGNLKGNALRAKQVVTDFVENGNGAIENGVRLSAYIEARKAGVSKVKAASFAKNLTVNFNRKGEAGTVLNSLYMFFNAAVQGNANFARAILTPVKDTTTGKRKMNTAQKVAASITASAAAFALLSRELGGEDDDGVPYWDKIPKGTRERNLVILKSLYGGEPGEYWKIPLPYGYNIFYNLGESAEAAINSKTRDGGDLMAEMALSVYGSFVPLGSPVGDDAAQSTAMVVSPTILKPSLEIGFNKNFFGGAIYRENNDFGPQKADAEMSMRSTAQVYKNIAQFLNDATGGSTYIQGGLDFSPDSIEHLVEFSLGGLYRFTNRVVDNVNTAAQGGQLDATDLPFARQLTGEIRPYQDISKFYDARQELKNLTAELKTLKGDDRLAFREKYGGKLKLQGMMSGLDKRLKMLRMQRDRIESDDALSFAEREEQLQRVTDRMEETVDKFNKRWNEAN